MKDKEISRGLEHIVFLSQVFGFFFILIHEAFLFCESTYVNAFFLALINIQSVAYSNAGGLAALLYSNAMRKAEEDERILAGLGIPCTIIRSAPLQDEQGGQKGFVFEEVKLFMETERKKELFMSIRGKNMPMRQILIKNMGDSCYPYITKKKSSRFPEDP